MISRTERGLSIAGTRITLYDVLSYLKADWPPGLIKNWLNLDETQIEAALSYIDEHRAEIEVEYQQVLRDASSSREYWETRNRERLASIATLPTKPGTEKLRAKLNASKIELGLN
jgi:hypothetical protein